MSFDFDTFTSRDGTLEVRVHSPLGGEYVEFDLWEEVSSNRYGQPVDAQLRSDIAQRLIEDRRPQAVQPPASRDAGAHFARANDQVRRHFYNSDGSLRVDVVDERPGRVTFELIDTDVNLVLYSFEVEGQPDDDECRTRAQHMAYSERPRPTRVMSDTRALDWIAAYLRVDELSGADLRMEVEQLVTKTGRDTATPGDSRAWAP